jgi:hypothetical protein
MVPLRPIGERHVSGADYIILHLPSASFLAKQGADPIVEYAGIDCVLISRASVIHRLSRFIHRNTSEESPPVLHLQSIDPEQNRFLKFPFNDFPKRAIDVRSFWTS